MDENEALRLKLSNFDGKVISKSFLTSLIREVVHDSPEKILKKLREKRKIQFIFRNYYYVLSENERKNDRLSYSATELVFKVLNKSNIKWYISFEKGLELNNVIHQAYRKINIINTKISGEKNILGTDFAFKKMNPKYVNNYKQKKTKSRTTQNIGSKEKIYLDFIYFRKRSPIELEKAIDRKKTIFILKCYPEKFKDNFKKMLIKNG